MKKNLGKNWIFDGNRIAWSLTDLKNGNLQVTVDLDQEYQSKVKRKAPDEVTIAVKKAKKVQFEKLTAYLKGQVSFDEGVLEAISKFYASQVAYKIRTKHA